MENSEAMRQDMPVKGFMPTELHGLADLCRKLAEQKEADAERLRNEAFSLDETACQIWEREFKRWEQAVADSDETNLDL